MAGADKGSEAGGARERIRAKNDRRRNVNGTNCIAMAVKGPGSAIEKGREARERRRVRTLSFEVVHELGGGEREVFSCGRKTVEGQ